MFSVVERFSLAVVLFSASTVRRILVAIVKRSSRPSVQCYAAAADVGVLTSITVTMPRLPHAHLTPARRAAALPSSQSSESSLSGSADW